MKQALEALTSHSVTHAFLGYKDRAKANAAIAALEERLKS